MFSNSPLVSVLINHYNYGQFLDAAIASALNQTYPYTQVIVVDDGSTDRSRKIIASYGDRIISVLKENGGQASAFNAGFAMSQGEIIIFLDSDDVLLPGIGQQVVEVFQQQPEIVKVQYQLQVIDSDGHKAAVIGEEIMLKAADIMTKNVVKIRGSATVAEAMQSMKENGLRAVIVDRRHDQDAYGMVTETDIVYKVAAFGT